MHTALLTWLTDPWTQALTRRALLEVALLGTAGGALGCWLVFFNLAYGAESLAHALLPGLVGAALLGLPLLLGGAAGLLVASLAVALAGRIEGLDRDTAVAVVVTTLFGLGVLLALSPDTPAGLQGLLFGDVLGVSDGDLLLAGALVAVVAGGLALAHPRLLVVAFDRAGAPGLGVGTLAVDVALLLLLAVTLLVAVQGLGNLLVVAVLIAPPSAARLVTCRMGTMLLASAAIAVASGIAGVYLSYHTGTAAGASIAGVLVLVYVVAASVASPSARRPDRGARPDRLSPAAPAR
jgi:ABC-type Mn2+/Zn2+ transport system permease subunit